MMKPSIATLLLGSLFAFVSPSSATVLEAEAFDSTLLRADAILFTTVSALNDASDDAEATDVSLADSRIVMTRWDRNGNAPSRIRVAGRRFDPGEVKIDRTGEVLKQQQRYLLLLQGGPWFTSPLLIAPEAAFPVVDGIVQCAGGGAVYGLGAEGLVCSTPAQQAGAPLTETEVMDLLARRLKQAAARRPALAQKYAAQSQPLQLTRKPRP
jgi:hypothetical protein